MLGVLVNILTVILAFLCILMSLVILMQRPKQEGLGAAFGGALTDRMLGSGTTDFLQRATVFMGVIFFLLSLTIATLMAYDRIGDRETQREELQDLATDGQQDATVTDAADGGVQPQPGEPVPSDVPDGGLPPDAPALEPGGAAEAGDDATGDKDAEDAGAAGEEGAEDGEGGGAKDGEGGAENTGSNGN